MPSQLAGKFPVDAYDEQLNQCATLTALQDRSFRELKVKVKKIILMLKQSNQKTINEDDITQKINKYTEDKQTAQSARQEHQNHIHKNMESILNRLSAEDYPLSSDRLDVYDRDIGDVQAFASMSNNLDVDTNPDYANLESMVELKALLRNYYTQLCEANTSQAALSNSFTELAAHNSSDDLKEFIIEQLRGLKENPKSPARSPDNCYETVTTKTIHDEISEVHSEMKDVAKATSSISDVSDESRKILVKLLHIIDDTATDKNGVNTKLDELTKHTKTAKDQQDNIISLLQEFCNSFKTKNSKNDKSDWLKLSPELKTMQDMLKSMLTKSTFTLFNDQYMKTVQELQNYQKEHLSSINKEIVNVRQVQSDELHKFKSHVTQDVNSKFQDINLRLQSVDRRISVNTETDSSVVELVKQMKEQMDSDRAESRRELEFLKKQNCELLDIVRLRQLPEINDISERIHKMERTMSTDYESRKRTAIDTSEVPPSRTGDRLSKSGSEDTRVPTTTRQYPPPIVRDTRTPPQRSSKSSRQQPSNLADKLVTDGLTSIVRTIPNMPVPMPVPIPGLPVGIASMPDLPINLCEEPSSDDLQIVDLMQPDKTDARIFDTPMDVASNDSNDSNILSPSSVVTCKRRKSNDKKDEETPRESPLWAQSKRRRLSGEHNASSSESSSHREERLSRSSSMHSISGDDSNNYHKLKSKIREDWDHLKLYNDNNNGRNASPLNPQYTLNQSVKHRRPDNVRPEIVGHKTFDNYQIDITDAMYKDLKNLFNRINLIPVEVAMRIMNIVQINKTDLRKYPWKGSSGCISYRGKIDMSDERDQVLINLRHKLIAVAIECNRYFYVRRLIMQHERQYFSPTNALHPDEYRMEFTIKAYIRGDFRIQQS